MDPTSREDLSALMDGELAPEPTRFLMRRLNHDPDLSAAWSRWHLIRACLSADNARMSVPGCDRDFAARVVAAVDADVGMEPQRRRRHWAQYVGGTAIAASVAVAALMLRVSSTATPQLGVNAGQLAPPAAVVAGVAEAPTTHTTSPWLLPHQPTVWGAQPASANIVYGTGLMQPDYLRRAAYAADVVVSPSYQDAAAGVPFSLVALPVTSSSVAAPPH